MMAGRWMAIAAVAGLLGVGLGAFGAHGLEGRISADALGTFEVGVRYHMYHALALFAVAWLVSMRPSRLSSSAGVFLVCGIVLFSGSLYGLVLLDWRWLGFVTPLGGVLLMFGWLLMAIAALRLPRDGMTTGATSTSESSCE